MAGRDDNDPELPLVVTPLSNGSATRMFSPLIPLAIPLALMILHGTLTGAGTPTGTRAGATDGFAVSESRRPKGPGKPTPTPVPACGGGTSDSPPCTAPVPMLSKGHPVAWWFVFKLNAASAPQCGNGDTRACPFGGEVQQGSNYSKFGQQYVYATAETPTLQQGINECLGTSVGDPVGATFDEVYNGSFHYVVWNDQTYTDPKIAGCSGNECGAPWGHSKGMVAWNDAGEGLVMQVSTPSWPMAGSANHGRLTDGNTLGCVKDNDVEVSQHFFALRLTKGDLITVLMGMGNASVVTDTNNVQVVSNGGPSDVMGLVEKLGHPSANTAVFTGDLSSGVKLISKPSKLPVPPWQMVSSVLGGVSLRTATWWIPGKGDGLPSTADGTVMGCWSDSLPVKPGAVDLAAHGLWASKKVGLLGGISPTGNHAKVGVSTSGGTPYTIFGDMNQDGDITGKKCTVSQNGRGGMFFVMNNLPLAGSVASLISGDSVSETGVAPGGAAGTGP